jgi:hypothetical protein
MSDITDMDYKETTTTNQTAEMSDEEKNLVRLNNELAQRQLKNIDELAPFQKELIQLSLGELRRQGAMTAAMDAAITPEDQAALAKQEFERAKRLGPIQDQILEMQMANMRGELTPGQKAAADAAIKAAHGDIDNATQEGIGLIADELANSRGLRLTDTPILREATLLSEQGLKQKSSAAANIRSSAMLQMPQISSGIGLSQQNLAQSTQAFQADLRQRAFQNRMALTGQGSSSGIGLSAVGGGAAASALASLSGVRAQNYRRYEGVDDPMRLFEAGSKMFGSMMGSDRRLKTAVTRIGKLPSGIPVYTFKYIGTEDEHVGVMADEVLPVIPEAVMKDEDGFYMVDYGMLR